MCEPGTAKKEAEMPMPEEAALIKSTEGDSKISIITILKEICGYCIQEATNTVPSMFKTLVGPSITITSLKRGRQPYQYLHRQKN